MRSLISTPFLVTLLFTNCGSSAGGDGKLNSSTSNSGFAQTMELAVDEDKKLFTTDDILALNYIEHKHLGLSVMSDKKDIQLAVVVYIRN